MKKLLWAVFATAVLAVFSVGQANATPIPANGAFSFAPTINGTGAGYTGASLATATAVTFSTANAINGYPATYRSQPNIFYQVGTIAVNLPTGMPVQNLNGGSYTYNMNDFMTWTVGSDTYTFDLVSGIWSSSVATGTLGFVGLGTFSDSLGTYTSGELSEINFSFSSTGFGNTTYSGVFEVPPSFVPEPSSLVLLGTGLLGAAFLLFRRKRSAKNGTAA